MNVVELQRQQDFEAYNAYRLAKLRSRTVDTAGQLAVTAVFPFIGPRFETSEPLVSRERHELQAYIEPSLSSTALGNVIAFERRPAPMTEDILLGQSAA